MWEEEHIKILNAVHIKTLLLEAANKQTQVDMEHLRAARKEDMITIHEALEKVDTRLDKQADVAGKAMLVTASLSASQKIITALIGASAGGVVSALISSMKRGVS